jgi:hypothetical protein
LIVTSGRMAVRAQAIVSVAVQTQPPLQ